MRTQQELEQRKRIIEPTLKAFKEANTKLDLLKNDPVYLAHLEKIRLAEKESNEKAQALYDLLWAL